jgi:hypothetical protein
MIKYSQAFWDEVYSLLVKEARAIEESRPHFLQIIDETSEYRFMGDLYMGGKLWHNSNRQGVPYVTCYKEDENVRIINLISTINTKLVEMAEKYNKELLNEKS